MSESIKGIFNQHLSAPRPALTGTQAEMVAKAPPEQQDFLRAQFKMQNEMELTQQITNMLKKLHDMSMSVARNI